MARLAKKLTRQMQTRALGQMTGIANRNIDPLFGANMNSPRPAMNAEAGTELSYRPMPRNAGMSDMVPAARRVQRSALMNMLGAGRAGIPTRVKGQPQPMQMPMGFEPIAAPQAAFRMPTGQESPEVVARRNQLMEMEQMSMAPGAMPQMQEPMPVINDEIMRLIRMRRLQQEGM
jgi:hypothetical protein